MSGQRTNYRSASVGTWALALTLLAGCGGTTVDDHDHEEDSWAVTAWGETYEIFAEADPLEAGHTSTSHTHVTILDSFAPLREGDVSIVLRNAAGSEIAFLEEAPIRDGIYSIEFTPESPGDYALFFRVDSPAGVEEIPAGRVQVADAGAHQPGGLSEPAAESARAETVAGSEPPISFLKEQQWKTAFATEWTGESGLGEVLRAPARIRPAAGGEVVLTSPVDGVVSSERWPHIGLDVSAGQALFRITPRVRAERSLAELESEQLAVQAELETARQRTARLEELLETGAASVAEVERARSGEAVLAAREHAVSRDLSTARSARQGESGSEGAIAIRAPFSGRLAEIGVTPGESAAAGDPIARLVKAEPVWLEVSLTADQARRLPNSPAGLLVEARGISESMAFEADAVRLVSVAPAISSGTGSVLALLEVDATVDDLRLGAAATVDILLAGERRGVVVPTTAIVDDAGQPVAFLQLDGESFARLEIQVTARHSDRVLVEGLPLGGRLVAVGGDAIRRATLVAADPGEGHVH